MTTSPILARCREALELAYGRQLHGLVLYGSEARGEADAESDIDLLVLLAEPFDRFAEMRRIIEVLYPIQLDSGRLISARPAGVREYRAGRLRLYRNVLREGVEV